MKDDRGGWGGVLRSVSDCEALRLGGPNHQTTKSPNRQSLPPPLPVNRPSQRPPPPGRRQALMQTVQRASALPDFPQFPRYRTRVCVPAAKNSLWSLSQGCSGAVSTPRDAESELEDVPASDVARARDLAALPIV